LSDHRFWADRFRLLVHAAVSWRLEAIRRRLVDAGAARLHLAPLRRRRLKIGGWVRERAAGLGLPPASSHPGAPLWHLLTTPRRPP
jgi:hypothetical protein